MEKQSKSNSSNSSQNYDLSFPEEEMKAIENILQKSETSPVKEKKSSIDNQIKKTVTQPGREKSHSVIENNLYKIEKQPVSDKKHSVLIKIQGEQQQVEENENEQENGKENEKSRSQSFSDSQSNINNRISEVMSQASSQETYDSYKNDYLVFFQKDVPQKQKYSQDNSPIQEQSTKQRRKEEIKQKQQVIYELKSHQDKQRKDFLDKNKDKNSKAFKQFLRQQMISSMIQKQKLDELQQLQQQYDNLSDIQEKANESQSQISRCSSHSNNLDTSGKKSISPKRRARHCKKKKMQELSLKEFLGMTLEQYNTYYKKRSGLIQSSDDPEIKRINKFIKTLETKLKLESKLNQENTKTLPSQVRTQNQLKHIFQFYAYQGVYVGGKVTFDKIDRWSQIIKPGLFFKFVKDFDLYSLQKKQIEKLTKEEVSLVFYSNSTFKEMEFEQFIKALREIAIYI